MSLSLIQKLNAILLSELPEYRAQSAQVENTERAQRELLRALMNVRPPRPLSAEFLRMQDALLSAEREARGVVDVMTLPAVPSDARIVLWQGDITRLNADAIVNAANSALLGCFIPCHRCIDNAIHSAAGLQLRAACAELMERQGHPEPTGAAKLTAGYNLPARHVLHTVGPIVHGALTEEHRQLLASCYRSCLALAAKNGLKSVAFCCISTGEFHFPNAAAAEIAVREVRDFLTVPSSIERVVFNVFKDADLHIYERLLL
ncbi:protein-ADP-ribose hydrolase [Selenomonas dianae]|uniref:Protein-ADP-ribose hydrolase n=1 Tax=Selenomonas dianae TaxID=135079 RepID=A0ABP3CS54_9FIRM|nr:protein-ADP-ribose hydrolase [Selenomonas dianae]WLD82460.1 protein-ADP-ribose hydrolase [Selenomonas dianae]